VRRRRRRKEEKEEPSKKQNLHQGVRKNNCDLKKQGLMSKTNTMD